MAELMAGEYYTGGEEYSSPVHTNFTISWSCAVQSIELGVSKHDVEYEIGSGAQIIDLGTIYQTPDCGYAVSALTMTYQENNVTDTERIPEENIQLLPGN